MSGRIWRTAKSNLIRGAGGSYLCVRQYSAKKEADIVVLAIGRPFTVG